MSCMSRAPASVPTIRTWPPVSGVPPTTTAVMALSSMRTPTNDGSLAPCRAVTSTPGRRREQSGDDVHADGRTAHGQTGERGRSGVAADGQQPAAKARAPHDQCQGHRQRCHHQQRDRHTRDRAVAEAGQRRVEQLDQASIGEHQGQAATGDQQPQCGHDGLDAEDHE